MNQAATNAGAAPRISNSALDSWAPLILSERTTVSVENPRARPASQSKLQIAADPSTMNSAKSQRVAEATASCGSHQVAASGQPTAATTIQIGSALAERR